MPLKELEYYPEIASYLRNEMQYLLAKLDHFVVDFKSCGNIDLSTGLEDILKNNPSIKDENLQVRIELTRGLYVDILGIIYSQSRRLSELIICEVKKRQLTLTDHAQLIGYCIASNIRYGLLIGIKGRITGGFEFILKNNPLLLKIDRKRITHKFGLCSWNPLSKELLFEDIGGFNSIEALCRDIAFAFKEIS